MDIKINIVPHPKSFSKGEGLLLPPLLWRGQGEATKTIYLNAKQCDSLHCQQNRPYNLFRR
jgi:hypothetical protein